LTIQVARTQDGDPPDGHFNAVCRWVDAKLVKVR
jgi:hypothetical protein